MPADHLAEFQRRRQLSQPAATLLAYLDALAAHSRERRKTYRPPTLEQIATALAFHARTIRKAKAELVAAGYTVATTRKARVKKPRLPRIRPAAAKRRPDPLARQQLRLLAHLDMLAEHAGLSDSARASPSLDQMAKALGSSRPTAARAYKALVRRGLAAPRGGPRT